MPAKLGRYLIDREFARGMSGFLYLAWDPHVDRDVVLKTLRGEEWQGDGPKENVESTHARALERFVREARVAAQLHHRAVVIVHDMGHDDASALDFIVLEHVPGESLLERLKRPMSHEEIVGALMPVAEALNEAHALGIIHRDVKPANILIRNDGAVKLADFGVAHVDDSDLTGAGVVLGSPSYMSPELIAGSALSGASDQFALAVVLYQLVTGRLPFEGGHRMNVLHRILFEEATPPFMLVDGIAEGVSDVIQRGLAKDPASRFSSCTALVRGFRAAAARDPGFRRQGSAATPSKPWTRRMTKDLASSDDFLQPTLDDQAGLHRRGVRLQASAR